MYLFNEHQNNLNTSIFELAANNAINMLENECKIKKKIKLLIQSLVIEFMVISILVYNK